MGITIQQLSVFLENREGRLDEVLSVLAGNDVNIVALSLADTTEYGMLRMIVSDPNKGKAVLKENGITAMLTDVIALRVPLKISTTLAGSSHFKTAEASSPFAKAYIYSIFTSPSTI